MHQAHSIALAIALASNTASAIDIEFRVFENDSFFIGHPERIAILEQAGDYFRGFTDKLAPIEESESNNWTATFSIRNGSNSITKRLDDLIIPQDTVVIYVASTDQGSLGFGGMGGYSMSGSQEFIDTVKTRGQNGALGDDQDQTDFARWGGSITFDNNIMIGNTQFDWSFDPSVTPDKTFDFLSTAIHEIGHVLGYSSNTNSWKNQNSGNQATGTYVTTEFGGNVPLTESASHFDFDTQSVRLDGTSQEAAMDPDIYNEKIKVLTRLDYAGFKEIGWEVPFLHDLPGDINNDKQVNNDDTQVVINNFGTESLQAKIGDLDGDSYINLKDLFEVRNNYGASDTISINIPEPTSAILFALGVTILTLRNKKSQ